jgi:[protein-PII] uridylyltransferase
MHRMVAKEIDAVTIRRVRAQVVNDPDLAGRSLARRLSQQADSWFESVAGDLPAGWSLMATGGYGGGVLCPGSDIDVILLYPQKTSDQAVKEVAEHLWYPLWDAGIKLSPAAHSHKSLLQLASDDLETATTVLRVRTLAGDADAVQRVQAAALDQWRKKSAVWLQRMLEASRARWEKAGDVASRLEPDLKDGRGGLRDHDTIRWALAVDRPEVTSALEGPFEDLAGPADELLAVRCELHRATGRTVNTLLLQDQDLVAEMMGFVDADALMFHVASAAHTVEWATARFWRRVERLNRKGGRSGQSGRPLPDPVSGVIVADDEVQLTAEADVDEQSFVFRMAAAAAHAGYPIGARSLRMMSSRGVLPGEVWTERTRRAFVSLLGAGPRLVSAVEALEQYDLFSRYLPEWRVVRSRPQRNAFHTYTVDRHLLQTVANASEFVRDVARPDLLLVGALLHDIGKGHPGDHTEVGVELVEAIGPRMGFPPSDVRILRLMVEHHLLLAETATRRDLSDHRTAAIVADAVGDVGVLELLVALTEADSKATGPAAWSPWKASLIDDLVRAVSTELRGGTRAVDGRSTGQHALRLLQMMNGDGTPYVEHEEDGEFDLLRIASRDRRGLFAVIAGTLALHGLDVVGASAFTADDGTVLDEFRILRSTDRATNWTKLLHDLRGALAGEVDIDARLEQRIKSYGRSHRRALAAAPPRLEVLISNDASDAMTVVEVRAPDGVAVLYRLSHALSAADLDIRSAKVATLGHEVVDVFYVRTPHTDDGKLQVHDHDELRLQLRAALLH